MRFRRSAVSFALLPLLALALSSCRATPSPTGQWRGVLTSPGGELPFGLRIDSGPKGLRAVVQNGSEEAPVSAVELKDHELVLRFDGYDSRIVATIEGDALTGKWEKRAKVGYASMPIAARRVGSAPAPRFRSASEVGIPALAANAADAVANVAGNWAVAFVDEDGTSPAEAELKQESSRVTGTIRTPTGDHRYLEGSYEGGILRRRPRFPLPGPRRAGRHSPRRFLVARQLPRDLDRAAGGRARSRAAGCLERGRPNQP